MRLNHSTADQGNIGCCDGGTEVKGQECIKLFALPHVGSGSLRLDGTLDVGGRLDGTGHKLDRERRRDGLCRPQKRVLLESAAP